MRDGALSFWRNLTARPAVSVALITCTAFLAHFRPHFTSAVFGAPESAQLVSATVETTPVPSRGDAADDAAVWVNPKHPSQSTVIGTNKQGGVAVYDLTGRQLQYLADGRLNNIDLRHGFRLNGQEIALVTAGNRSDDTIAIYRVNGDTGLLENVAARKVRTTSVYGSCMYRSHATGKFYYIVTSKNGTVEQWELVDDGRGKVDAKQNVRTLRVGSQSEGCVADDELGHLYVGEENVGIWKYGAEPEAGDRRTSVDRTGRGGHLVADVEGLAIVQGKDGTGFLFASSQGNSSFVIYRREGNNPFVKVFRVVDGDRIDAVEDTDGIEVAIGNLGTAFPRGIFVAQDGFNDNGNQNFKLVPLDLILGLQ